MMYWRLTECYQDGAEHRAVFVPWWVAGETLGHRYDGDQGDLEQLKAAALKAGAPSWVGRVMYDGIERRGIYLIGGPIVYAEALMKSYHLWELEDWFGTVEHEGSTWYLTQMPYIAGTDESPWYEAMAIDADGNAALVWWSVVDDWRDIEDESDVCQWDKPAGVIRS